MKSAPRYTWIRESCRACKMVGLVSKAQGAGSKPKLAECEVCKGTGWHVALSDMDKAAVASGEKPKPRHPGHGSDAPLYTDKGGAEA